MIKAGQIYKGYNGFIFAITRVKKDVNHNVEIHLITPSGLTMQVKNDFGGVQSDLIAEYPTWQDAVNSKEFNND